MKDKSLKSWKVAKVEVKIAEIWSQTYEEFHCW